MLHEHTPCIIQFGVKDACNHIIHNTYKNLWHGESDNIYVRA